MCLAETCDKLPSGMYSISFCRGEGPGVGILAAKTLSHDYCLDDNIEKCELSGNADNSVCFLVSAHSHHQENMVLIFQGCNSPMSHAQCGMLSKAAEDCAISLNEDQSYTLINVTKVAEVDQEYT